MGRNDVFVLRVSDATAGNWNSVPAPLLRVGQVLRVRNDGLQRARCIATQNGRSFTMMQDVAAYSSLGTSFVVNPLALPADSRIKGQGDRVFDAATGMESWIYLLVNE